ncbi:MAG: flavin-containing monooxygenase [Myxococcota bacterium]
MGAGPGGLCMAIRLRQAGFNNFTLFEKSDQVGGTWNQNRYPGCACDIPSHLYSFSFEVKPDWSRPYAPQPEILEYLEGIAEKYDLIRSCEFGVPVQSATWDDAQAKWTLEFEGNRASEEADIVVSAIGMFNEIVLPEIEGLDQFEGKTFHSSQWDWDYDLSDKKVGVVGSAASAVQFIPEITKTGGQIHLFQRSANWVLPKADAPYSEEELTHFRTDPDAANLLRAEIFQGIDTGTAFTDSGARSEMEAAGLGNIEVVEDEALREKLVPTHPWGCKRPLFSNEYYPAFNEPNLELVTDPIERITATGIVTKDGVTREIDTLVLATGFAATKYLSAIEVQGRDGVRLEEVWKDGAQAYLGVTTSGFPNLFMLYGPNTNNGSLITMIEFEVDHAMGHIERIASEGLAWVDVKADPMASYNTQLQEDIEAVEVWGAGCNGYYRSPSGRVVTQWPHSMSAFGEQLKEIDPEAFESKPRSS